MVEQRELGGRAGARLLLLAACAAGLGGCSAGADSSVAVDPAGDDAGAPSGPAAGDAGDDPNLAVRPEPAFAIFDFLRMHEIALSMAPADWQSILDDSRGDEDRHATLTYDGVVVADVGVRPSGESSRFPGNPKMSLHIKFDAFPGRGPFGGLGELKLKGQWADDSMMRERLAFHVYGAAVPVPQEADARLVVNGDVRGLYTVVQVWDAESIHEHFPARPPGPLYRIRGGVDDPYKYLGDDPKLYMPLPWEPHIDVTARGDDVIGWFLRGLAASPPDLAGVADVDQLLGYLAASTLVMNTDGMVGDTGVEDHFEYFDPGSGRFSVLPWDCDNTFGSANEKPDRSIYTHFGRTVPATIVRDSADLAQRYKEKIRSIIAAVPAGVLQAEADSIYQQIADTVHADPVKRSTNGAFDWSVGYIKDFIAQRYAFVAAQATP
jgi:spore coat protein CotH